MPNTQLGISYVLLHGGMHRATHHPLRMYRKLDKLGSPLDQFIQKNWLQPRVLHGYTYVPRIPQLLGMEVSMDVKPISTPQLSRVNGDMSQNAVGVLRSSIDPGEIPLVDLNRVVVMISQNQPLQSIQGFQDLMAFLTEKDIPQMPDRVLRVDRCVPPLHQRPIVLFDRSERAKDRFKVDDVLMAEMRIGDDVNFIHF